MAEKKKKSSAGKKTWKLSFQLRCGRRWFTPSINRQLTTVGCPRPVDRSVHGVSSQQPPPEVSRGHRRRDPKGSDSRHPKCILCYWSSPSQSPSLTHISTINSIKTEIHRTTPPKPTNHQNTEAFIESLRFRNSTTAEKRRASKMPNRQLCRQVAQRSNSPRHRLTDNLAATPTKPQI
ncbi:hypothetical protein F2Q68_00044875 [Brassica cretica]|uniref:Uncharacterized protein n=1 Tax=Brassica cretica TaxID=69181 RepID=A0A8S9LNE1_BRACR|nr:hypothetical protein F2Q68_00044875 [Brassica cretica]